MTLGIQNIVGVLAQEAFTGLTIAEIANATSCTATSRARLPTMWTPLLSALRTIRGLEFVSTFAGSVVSVITLLALATSGCTPFNGPFKTGKLSAETERILSDGYRLLYRLHKLDGGGQVLYVWCASPNTLDQVLRTQLSEVTAKAAFTERGWHLLGGARFHGPVTQLDLEKIPGALFSRIDSAILIFNPESPSITLDGCRTSHWVDPFNVLKSEIEAKEIVWAATEPLWSRPPFLHAFRFESNSSQACFAVNPRYVVNKSNTYDVCSKNAGKFWYFEKRTTR